MLILGFGSKARQGKDTAAKAIQDFYETENQVFEKHGWRGNIVEVRIFKLVVKVGIFKFATALYQEVNDWLKQTQDFGKELGQLYFVTDENKKVHPLPNWVQPDLNPEISELAPYGKHPKLLQWWGTDFRRKQDPDYWINRLFESIPNTTDIALITDVRFPNEFSGVKQRGGYTINVQRLRDDGQPFYSDDRPADHPSETALDKANWDFYLKIPEGHQVLTGELAVMLCEYLRGLNAKTAN